MKRLRNLIQKIKSKLISKYILARKAFLKDKKLGLYHGDDMIFKDNIVNSLVYGEYGCGTSTIYASNNSSAEILSVDTSEEWTNKVRNSIRSNNTLNIKFINVGKTSEWGYPISYSNRKVFIKYISFIWEQSKLPDLILIDGRFRVACFLYSLMKAKKGTKIIFDDYNRKEYHVVEEYIKPIQIEKDQALFIVPEIINTLEIKSEFEKFIYVLN